MVFGKRFPKDRPGSNFPDWVEVQLSAEEEAEIEKEARVENLNLLSKCIDDARLMFKKKGLKENQTDILSVAISLFEKAASHTVYHKEARCKDKFDRTKESISGGR
jgi:hypothetical protein